MPETKTHTALICLRRKSGAGILDCQKALEEAGGDEEKALEILRKKGLADAAKRSSRPTCEGLIHSYIHAGGKVGALLELNCETDFVARTEEFRNLAKELALQIVGAAPRWVRKEEVPPQVIEGEKEIYRQQALHEKKPPPTLERIVEGKLAKFFQQFCLLEQPSIRDASGKKSVLALIQEAASKLGENITVRRFLRYQLGGDV
ncbi:MAG: elongation factor Ts [Elusimicrobia bacterium]|nr:elongation factor Ts [Elusimicrobiota bacterium]